MHWPGRRTTQSGRGSGARPERSRRSEPEISAGTIRSGVGSRAALTGPANQRDEYEHGGQGVQPEHDGRTPDRDDHTGHGRTDGAGEIDVDAAQGGGVGDEPSAGTS